MTKNENWMLLRPFSTICLAFDFYVLLLCSDFILSIVNRDDYIINLLRIVLFTAVLNSIIIFMRIFFLPFFS